MKLAEIENEYINSYLSHGKAIEDVYKKGLSSKVSLDLTKRELTECLIQRMRTYYETQDRIKNFLNKRYASPAADFFVESTLFFLKLLLEKSSSKLEAHSERQIKRARNAIRPDISIWQNDEVVSIIECKTQLGWNRSNWEIDFKKREKKLKKDFPNANAYLLVMTGNNWQGFSEEHISSKKFYCLLNNIWPNESDKELIKNNILTPVEDLFKEVLKNG